MSSPVPAELLQSKSNQSWIRNEPFLQPFYRFDEERGKGKGSWVEVIPSATRTSTPDENNTAVGDSDITTSTTINTTTTATTTTTTTTTTQPSKFRLITWNIDALIPHAEARMAGALEYLESLYKQHSARETPLVIFLQEMLQSDLAQIQQAEWIRQHFYVTDLTTEFWESPFYGTTTLIEKRFAVQRVFRVHYGQTRMQRDALFVDVDVEVSSRQNSNDSPEESSSSPLILLRLCNTHLESLVSNPPLRPRQMELASTFMHGSGKHPPGGLPLPAPHASALAGDLNAFAPDDRTAPIQSGLRDAFLVLGGKEDTDESYTWGQQVPEETRRAFGCSRMDKILFCGGLRVDSLERIGEGVKVELPPAMIPGEAELATKVWVTDHLGLMAEFTVVDQEQADKQAESTSDK